MAANDLAQYFRSTLTLDDSKNNSSRLILITV